MKRYKILIMLLVIFSSCNERDKNNLGYNTNASKLIISNQLIRDKVVTIFDLNDTSAKVLKVLLSRRDRFVRVTIYNLVNKDQLSESPSGVFNYKLNTFLCYDGTEIINSDRIDSKLVNRLKAELSTGYINDSKVFQFDISSEKKITFNVPAINPYDLTERNNPFPLSK